MKLDLLIFHGDCNSQKTRPQFSTWLQRWMPREHSVLLTIEKTILLLTETLTHQWYMDECPLWEIQNPVWKLLPPHSENDTNLIKGSRKNYDFHLASSLPPAQHHTSGENSQLPISPWGGKEKTIHQWSDFSGGCPRDWFLSRSTQTTEKTQHTLEAWWGFWKLELGGLQYCK